MGRGGIGLADLWHGQAGDQNVVAYWAPVVNGTERWTVAMATTDPIREPHEDPEDAGWDSETGDDAVLDEPMLVFETQQEFIEGFDEDDFDEDFDDDFEEEFEDEYEDLENDLLDEEEVVAEEEEEVADDFDEPLDEDIDDVVADDLEDEDEEFDEE